MVGPANNSTAVGLVAAGHFHDPLPVLDRSGTKQRRDEIAASHAHMLLAKGFYCVEVMSQLSNGRAGEVNVQSCRLHCLITELETDVQADPPNSEQVTAHTNALLKQLSMMSKMDGRSKAGKKKMEMKKKPEMKM